MGGENCMKEWLTFIAGSAVTIIHAMAMVIVIVGTIEAFLRSIRPSSALRQAAARSTTPTCGMRVAWLVC
jgi:hypothetical protein